jgi:uncharacterized protein (TIGR02996 family)
MHPTNARFILDICQNPDDDGPRLKYAEFLEASTWVMCKDRGKFIRAQCELARLQKRGPRREHLIKQQKQLLRQWGKHWLKWELPEEILPLLDKASYWVPQRPGTISLGPYERGFIDRATIGWGNRVVTKSLAALLEAIPLRTLSYSGGTRGFGAAFTNTARVASLHSIILRGDAQFATLPRFNTKDFGPLWRCPHLVNLTSLVVDSYDLGDEGIQPLARAQHLRSLQFLRLTGVMVGDKAVSALVRFPHLGHLRMLDLGFNRITAAGARMLAGAAGLETIHRLNLKNNERLEKDKEAVRALRTRFGPRLII